MIGTILITWSLLYWPGGDPKVIAKDISTKQECYRVATLLHFGINNYACVETKTVVYLPVEKK